VDLCCDGIVTQAASISDTKIEVVSLLLKEPGLGVLKEMPIMKVIRYEYEKLYLFA